MSTARAEHEAAVKAWERAHKDFEVSRRLMWSAETERNLAWERVQRAYIELARSGELGETAKEEANAQ
jgi:hypothetical protein